MGQATQASSTNSYLMLAVVRAGYWVGMSVLASRHAQQAPTVEDVFQGHVSVDWGRCISVW